MAGILNLVTVALAAILSIRLFVSGLYRRYRAFFCYLVFYALREGVLGSLDTSNRLYEKIWVLTEPVEWFFLALVVLELYSLVLYDYQGLATAGRWALIMAVVVALAASGISLLAPSHDTLQGALMRYYYVADRAIYFSLVVFLLTILGFLMQYPVILSRNIIVHSIVFSVYFLSNTFIFVLLSTRGYTHQLLDAVVHAIEVINIAAMATWLAMLTPAGEFRKLRMRPAWMPGREEVLVGQLNQLNATLLRARRK